MPYKKFTGKLFKVHVATVTADAYQEILPPLCPVQQSSREPRIGADK